MAQFPSSVAKLSDPMVAWTQPQLTEFPISFGSWCRFGVLRLWSMAASSMGFRAPHHGVMGEIPVTRSGVFSASNRFMNCWKI